MTRLAGHQISSGLHSSCRGVKVIKVGALMSLRRLGTCVCKACTYPMGVRAIKDCWSRDSFPGELEPPAESEG